MIKKECKHIVFLDIDGVLASEEYLCSSRSGSFMFIDPEKVKLLNKLKSVNAEIVVSSSWGYDNGNTEKKLKECGLELPIIGYTQHFYDDWICRGNEIEKWLRDNIGGMCTKWGDKWRKASKGVKYEYEYVIFDDSEDMLLGQKDHFIQTNETTGLTEKDIEKAIDILTRK